MNSFDFYCLSFIKWRLSHAFGSPVTISFIFLVLSRLKKTGILGNLASKVSHCRSLRLLNLLFLLLLNLLKLVLNIVLLLLTLLVVLILEDLNEGGLLSDRIFLFIHNSLLGVCHTRVTERYQRVVCVYLFLGHLFAILGNVIPWWLPLDLILHVLFYFGEQSVVRKELRLEFTPSDQVFMLDESSSLSFISFLETLGLSSQLLGLDYLGQLTGYILVTNRVLLGHSLNQLSILVIGGSDF